MRLYQTVLGAALKKRGDQTRFANSAKVSKGQFTNILKDRRAPDEDEALRYADVLRLKGAEKDAFLASAATHRASTKSDSTAHIAAMEGDLKAALSLASDLLEMCLKNDLQLPKAVEEGISILKNRWKL